MGQGPWAQLNWQGPMGPGPARDLCLFGATSGTLAQNLLNNKRKTWILRFVQDPLTGASELVHHRGSIQNLVEVSPDIPLQADCANPYLGLSTVQIIVQASICWISKQKRLSNNLNSSGLVSWYTLRLREHNVLHIGFHIGLQQKG